MTSETGCYVYITLPGETLPTTAGRYVLAEGRGGEVRGEFVYGRRYMARPDAVEIDPVELAGLAERRYTTVRAGGLFGALRDACPDAWGRRVIEKRLGSPGVGMADLDYMLNSPDDRAGALGFGLGQEPPAPLRRFNRTLHLATLMEVADRIVEEDGPDAPPRPLDGRAADDVEQIEQLLAAGTSMGGARPKATVKDGPALWVAKFPLARDRWNNPRVEHATMQLARRCGISAAETRVLRIGDRDVLMVKRFDRADAGDGFHRIRMVSALTMLGAEEDERGKWSYLQLADEIRRRAVGGQPRQVAELFRRMAFNALVSNTDDHPRNHAFLAEGKSWNLSPAYDLTPTPAIGHGRRLAMECGPGGRDATRENLLSGHGRFLLDPGQAEAILDEVEATVEAGWYPAMREAGVTETDAGKVRSAFCPPGFRTDTGYRGP